MKPKNRLLLTLTVILITIASLLLPACNSSNTSAQIASYIIADETGDWGYPSPYLHYSRGPGYIRMSLVFDTLVWKDEDGFVPALAKEWSYDETDNAYTFELQENAVWHDGQPITAEDVAFTISYVEEHPNPFVTLVGATGIDQVEVIDDYTIKLYLESIYAPFLYDVAGTMVILPKHIWETVDDPTTFDGDDAVIGSGPYKLADYNKAEGTYLYEAFEDYYQGKPVVDQLIFAKVGTELVNAALAQGDVNAASIEGEMVSDMEGQGFTVIKGSYSWNAKMTINHKSTTKDALTRKAFRQAMAYAIDRQDLVDVTQRGYGIAGSPCILTPDNPWYNPLIEQYEYNPTKAHELIEGLGYTLNGDGFYEKDGVELELELLSQTSFGFAPVGQYIEDALEDVGIKIELVIMEGKSLDAKVEDWDFDLSVYGHGGLYEPSILNKVITGSGFNSARYTGNTNLNNLLEDQMQEMNPDERLAMVQQAEMLYAEDMPAITLYHPDSYWAHDGNIEWYFTDGGVASGIPIAINKMSLLG